MKKETSSVKFWKCAIGCNFVSVKWNDKGTFIPKGWVWHIKLEYAKRLFLMPYYRDRDRKCWLSHCFLSFGLCDKMGLRDMAIKVSRCQHGKKKKSPWLYSFEAFQGIPPRIFPCHAIVGESLSEVRGLSFFDDG